MTTTRQRLGLLLIAALGAAGLGSAPPPAAAATDPEVVWLCKPGIANNPCEIPLDTTYQRADGTSTTSTLARKRSVDRPVDCFYVYPTVSDQLALTASKAKDPEIISIAKYQAARFSSRCRMYAPVYRQATFAGILGLPLGSMKVGYGDVLQAWRSYLKNDNRGRGVVLIGHSQGTIVLRELIRKEIDPYPTRRAKLVGALLLGGNVTVAQGKTSGGDFTRVPTCSRSGQAGCVVAYSTYASDPTVAFFGNTFTDATAYSFGFRSGAGYQVACTDPGRLSASTAPVRITVPSEPFATGPISAGILVTTAGQVPTAETTWVSPYYRYTGACRSINGANVFRYDPVPGSLRPLEFPPTWGTHLLDGNLGLEKLLRIVQLQTQTWLAQN